MASRRVGSENSATRHELLDAVERLMLDSGYASVTYRAVAAKVGVTAGLVQYYFPSLDELFIATIRRRSEQNLERLQAALDGSAEPLAVLWEYSNNEATAALTSEFMALGNHRHSIRDEIEQTTKVLRDRQFQVAQRIPKKALKLQLTPEALVFLVMAVPKLIQLERAVGIDAGHDEIVAAVRAHLDALS